MSRWAVQFATIKQAAEFFGRRPRRFALLLDQVHNGRPAANLRPGAKRIHFIRHGQGHHNVWRDAEHAAGRVPWAKRGNVREVPQELHDPHLTEKGREEAVSAQERARGCSPELLVTSPMRRAAETLLLAFDGAVKRGVPIIAHELCREQFRGLDPSLYDVRKGRAALANEFPQIDFQGYVLPELELDCGNGQQSQGSSPARSTPQNATAAASGGLSDDPLWWLCASPLGRCEEGLNEAAMVEHAYGFLCWLMARPEKDIAVATHSLFLLALHYGALDLPNSDARGSPEVFHTGELRSLVIEESARPEDAPEARLARWGEALLGSGLPPPAGGQGVTSAEPLPKRRRPATGTGPTGEDSLRHSPLGAGTVSLE